MYLADSDIRRRLPQMEIRGPHPEHPFQDDAQIQPSSIDLRVSNVFWKPSRRRLVARWLLRRRHVVDLRRAGVHDLDALRDWKRVELADGECIDLKPGQVVMARIYERFRMPSDCAGKIEGRSSYARLGLGVHLTGDFINPGWEGFMPLQLFNGGPYTIRVPPYLPVCQLMLVPLSTRPDKTYGDAGLDSKYADDDGGPSRWWREDRVRQLQQKLGAVNLTERIQQDVVKTMRDRSPAVLERFQRFLDRTRAGSITNYDELLTRFARSEDRRRRWDRVALASPGVSIGVVASLATGASVWWTVGFAVATLATSLVAFAAYLRQDGGYFGSKESRDASRPRGTP